MGYVRQRLRGMHETKALAEHSEHTANIREISVLLLLRVQLLEKRFDVLHLGCEAVDNVADIFGKIRVPARAKTLVSSPRVKNQKKIKIKSRTKG